MLGQTGVTVSSQADLLEPGSSSLLIFLRRFLAVSEVFVQEAEIRLLRRLSLNYQLQTGSKTCQ